MSDRFDFDPPRKSDGNSLGIVLGISGIVVVVIIALLATGVFREKRIAELPPAAPESADEKFQVAVAAFKNQAPGDDDPDAQAIRGVLDSLVEGMAQGDQSRLGDLFDMERMYQEIRRHSSSPPHSAREEKGFLIGLRQGVARGMAQNADLLDFTSIEIKRCQFTTDRDEALVFARIGAHDTKQKYRWWLVKRDGRWQIYDFEDLGTGIRSTVAVASAMDMAGGNQERLVGYAQQTELLGSASRALLSGDLDEAERNLKQINLSDLPANHQALAHMLHGTLLLGRGRAQEAIDFYSLARQQNPDMVIVDMLKAAAYNSLGEFEQAKSAAEAYLARLGDDADGYEQLAAAYEGLGQTDKAIDALRKGLDEDPDSVDCLYTLATLLPEDKKAEVGERFAKTQQTDEQFELLYNSLSWIDAKAASEIAKQYAKVAPNHPSVISAAVLELIEQKDYRAAADKAKAALDQADGESGAELMVLYAQAMIELGAPLDAYRELSQSGDVFVALAAQLLNHKKHDELRALIAAHQANSPNHSQLHHYQGELALVENQPDEALASLRKAYELAEDDALRSSSRYRLGYELFQANRAMEAYSTLEPKADVFTHLAELALSHKKPDALEPLLKDYREDDPNNASLPGWVMQLAYLKGDYESTVDQIQRNGPQIRAAEDTNSYYVDDRLIRSLVQLKRFDDADRENERMSSEDTSRELLRLLVAVGRGDVERADQLMQQLVDAGWEPYDFHQDDFIGPALQTEPFAAIREKYRDPFAEEEGESDAPDNNSESAPASTPKDDRAT